ncbi:MAG: ComEA family DNA-binding protein [Acidimicrobiales bacterium]
MSDPLSELPRPPRPLTWRDRLTEWAESLDLTPTRLIVGLAGLVVAGVLGWKLLAPPPPPPEMQLPFVSTTGPSGGSTDGGDAGDPAADATSPPTSEQDEVVIHVAGAVAAPGVHRLAADARVVDAVDAAGGAGADADLGRLNLAARLEDGQQVYVPRVGEVPPQPTGAGAAGGGPSDAGGDPSAGQPVDLNTATVDELDGLPGIGPSIAQAIVDHRDEHGSFTSVDQLVDVRGIGEAKLEQLRPLVTV